MQLLLIYLIFLWFGLCLWKFHVCLYFFKLELGRGKWKVSVIFETIDYKVFCTTEGIKTNPQTILHKIAEIYEVQIVYFMWHVLGAHQRLRKYIFLVTFAVHILPVNPLGAALNLQ